MLVDSHCHLDLMNPELDRVGDYLDRARGEGVEHFLCVAVSLENAPVVRDLAQHHAGVYASVGVHPNHDEGPALTRDELTRLAGDPQIVAVGETGLDYFRNPVDAQLQQERLRIQVRSARDVGKPLIIHMREATEDTLRILDEEGAHEVGGVMHCFVEDYDTACRAMELGFYISFSGIVTFRNAEKVRDAARRVPDERLLVQQGPGQWRSDGYPQALRPRLTHARMFEVLDSGTTKDMATTAASVSKWRESPSANCVVRLM